MKSSRIFIAAAVAGTLASVAWAQTMSSQDFVIMAASSDMFEIRSSELALQKAQDATVKELAQMMIRDHMTATNGLVTAAKQDGFSVPTQMVDKHAEEVKTLEGVPAGSFDASYVDAQVAAHEEALRLMTSFAESGEGAALKAHAQKTAPVIKMHLEHIQKLDKQQM